MSDLLIIAILAGGLSTRMGTDKAMLTIDGEPLLVRIARAAGSTGRRTLVVGRPRPENWSIDGVEFISDDLAEPPSGGEAGRGSGLGPIGGLAAAFRHGGSAVLMLACDMPKLSTSAIDWLAAEAENRRSVHGLAVSNDGQIEPLFSVYQPTLQPLVDKRIAEGRRSLYGLIELAAFDVVDAPEHIRPALVNVNTVEEWQREQERQ